MATGAAIRERHAALQAQVRRIRWRRNAHVVQHAFYVAGSLVALDAVLLIALAFRSGPGVFAAGLQLCALLLAVALVVFVVLLYRGWSGLVDAARCADRQAGMGERLSSALIEPDSEPARTPLYPALLAEVQRKSDHWDPRRIVPRLVPRSLACLLLAVAALYIAARTLPPTPPVAAKSATDAPSAPHPAGAHASTAEIVGQSEGSSMRGSNLSMGSPGSTGNRERAGGGRQAGAAGSSATASGLGPRFAASDVEESENDLARRLQEMIRDALGAESEAASGSRLAAAGTEGRAGEAGSAGPPEPSAAGESPLAQRAGGQPEARPARTGTGEGPRGNGPGGAGRAGGPGGEASGQVFGEAAADGDGDLAERFRVQLTGSAVAYRTYSEPQRRRENADVEDVGPLAPGDDTREVASAQSADSIIRKIPIVPDLESLMRRIYRKGE